MQVYLANMLSLSTLTCPLFCPCSCARDCPVLRCWWCSSWQPGPGPGHDHHLQPGCHPLCHPPPSSHSVTEAHLARSRPATPVAVRGCSSCWSSTPGSGQTRHTQGLPEHTSAHTTVLTVLMNGCLTRSTWDLFVHLEHSYNGWHV
jgi:hypothetical protein